MTLSRPWVLMLMAAVLVGGHAWAQPAAPAASAPHAAAEPLQMKLNFQQARTTPARDLTVQFVGYQDSRCPAGVQCIWEGDARAFFWVSGTDLAPQVLTLAWAGQPVQVGRYRAVLMALEPDPRASGASRPAGYRATVGLQPSPP